MSANELKSFTTEQLAELVKEKHIYPDNDDAIFELIEEREENTREELENMEYGSLEYLAHDAIDWMDRDQLLEFIDTHSLFLI